MSTDDDDRRAIRALIAEYCRRLDAGDLDGVAALFEHATFRSTRHDRVLEGAGAVRTMYDDVILYDDGTPRTRHLVTDSIITLDPGFGTAHARSTFLVVQSTEPGTLRMVLAGDYHDRFERAGGAWRFAERLVDPALIGDVGMHMRRA